MKIKDLGGVTNPPKMSGTEFLRVSSVSKCSHTIHGGPYLCIYILVLTFY